MKPGSFAKRTFQFEIVMPHDHWLAVVNSPRTDPSGSKDACDSCDDFALIVVEPFFTLYFVHFRPVWMFDTDSSISFGP